ncbi:hypothetical protein E3P78_04035 [Wallemia ichthyophaga]|nr:hypothetical protein E3P78_04035 [Wallemia ichthyophaga]
MSVDIDYTKLDQSLADNLLSILNERLEEMQKPSILGHIEFTNLSWGDMAPDIELEEIGELSEEFNESDEEDVDGEDEAHEAADLKHPAQIRDSSNNHNASESQPKRASSTIPNMQIQLRITHESDMRLTLLTNLLVNFPSPGFMSLPVKLAVRGIVLHSKAIIGIDSQRRQVHFSLVEPYDENSEDDDDVQNHILQSLVVESEIGDVDRHTLKNVRKVENFVLEYLRNLLNNEIVWPNYHTFILDD